MLDFSTLQILTALTQAIFTVIIALVTYHYAKTTGVIAKANQRMAAASKLSVEQLKKQVEEISAARLREAFVKVVEDLSSVNTFNIRQRRFINPNQLILKHPKLEREIMIPKRYSKDYQMIDRVWRLFDRVGLLVKLNIIPENLVIEMFLGTILDYWQKFEPYIRRERQFRQQKFGQHFEHLYQRTLSYTKGHYPEQLTLRHLKSP